MRYKKIFLLGGTTEGRKLCAFLKEKKVEVWVSVATDYGKECLDEALLKMDSVLLETAFISVLHKRLTEEEMVALLKKESFDLVIDATHPYAQVVTHSIKEACSLTHTPYKRIIRRMYKEGEAVHYFKTVDEMVTFLNEGCGNVLLTTGSKDLPHFTKVKDFEERLYVRMLPVAKTIENAVNMGYKMSHLICMQGPFSVAMNKAMLEHIKGNYMVTKDSGEVGGFLEKVEAAKEKGVELLVLERPEEERGLTLEEMYTWLEDK